MHSVNITTAFSQVKVGGHITDFIVVNGEGIVYEIKTDLDNFDKLRDQLNDYLKAFSKMFLLECVCKPQKVLQNDEKSGKMRE